MAVRFRAYYNSGRGRQYRADVWDRTFTGGITEFDAGPDGHFINTEGSDDIRFSPVKGTRCTLPMLVDRVQLDDFVEEMASRPERDFAILIYEDGALSWFGYIAQDLLQQDDISYPYIVELTATDGLGSLKMPYDLSAVTISNLYANIQAFIHELLAFNGLAELVPAHHPWLRVNFEWHAQVLGAFTRTGEYTERAEAGSFTIDANALARIDIRLTAARRSGTFVLPCFTMQYRDAAAAGGFTDDSVAINAVATRAASSHLLTTGNYGSDTRNDWQLATIQRTGLVKDYSSRSSFTSPPVGEMLARIMQSFGARIYFDGGSFCIDQVHSLSSRYVNVHVYYPDGTKAYVIDQEDRQLELDQASMRPTKRLGGGMRRYMRPLKEVQVNFAPNLSLNFANIRNAQGAVIAGNFLADENFALLYRGEFRAKKLDAGRNFFFKVWLRLELRISEIAPSTDDWYFTNGDPDAAPSRYNWKPAEGQWVQRSAGAPKAYYHILLSDFAQQGAEESSTRIEFRTTALPANGELTLTANYHGLINAINVFTPKFPLGQTYIDVELSGTLSNRATDNEELYLVVNSAIDNDSVQYRVTRSTDTDAIQVVDDVRLGDGPVAFMPSSVVFFQPNSLPVTSGGWKRLPADGYEELGQLLASEIMFGQQKAVTKFDMIVLSSSPIRLRNLLKIGTKLYAFNGVKKYATKDEYEGTWFEVAEDQSGLTKSKQRLLRSFFSQPVAISTGGASGDIIEPALDLGINILRRLQVTQLTEVVAAGTKTSLPITALGEAYLQAGDRLGLVHLGTGQIYDLQLTAAVSASATSIAIASITLPEIPIGSFVIFTGQRLARMIKKIDSGTLAGLPVSTGGIGDGASPVQIDTSTGNVRTDGDLDVQAISAVDVQADELQASVSIKAGTQVTLDAATGNITAAGNVAAADVNASGNVAAGGNVSGDEVLASVAIKAGSQVTLDAATGNITAAGDVAAADVNASGNVAAGGNVTGDELQAAVALKAGTKVTFNGATGESIIDGPLAVNDAQISGEVNVGGEVFINALEGVVSESKPVKGSSLFAGEEVQINGTTGAIDTTGDIGAAGNVSGEEVIGASTVKAGSKVTLDAVTGNVSADGNMAAGGNVSGDEVQAAVALKAGTKVTIDAATGNVAADGDVSANDVTATGAVNAGTLSTTGDVSIGRDLTVAKKMILNDLPLEFEAINQVYLEADDAGAYTLKIKLTE